MHEYAEQANATISRSDLRVLPCTPCGMFKASMATGAIGNTLAASCSGDSRRNPLAVPGRDVTGVPTGLSTGDEVIDPPYCGVSGSGIWSGEIDCTDGVFGICAC